MKVIYQKIIKREDLIANPNIAYLFGDNMMEVGYGEQAGEMRWKKEDGIDKDLWNGIGVPTQIYPSTAEECFFNNEDFLPAKARIDKAFCKVLNNYDTVVIPLDGLGTGLAELDSRAPKIFKYILEKISKL